MWDSKPKHQTLCCGVHLSILGDKLCGLAKEDRAYQITGYPQWYEYTSNSLHRSVSSSENFFK